MGNLKKWSKALCLTMAMMLLLSGVVPTVSCVTTVQAASKVKLNKTKVTLYEGDSVKLKVSGTSKKVTWKSSNKTVATVSSKGTVKAKKKGTAKVTATVSKKKYTCKVTVKENTVTNNNSNNANEVYYISSRYVEYFEDDSVERFFFGLQNQSKSFISASGSVDLRIENNGVVVYQKTVEFNSNNFSNWKNSSYGTRYLCSIDIPISDITAGKNSTGVLYYKIVGGGVSFDEYSLNVYNLPKEERVITVDTTSYISDSYTPENKVQIISYNISDSKIFLTCKVVEVGSPNRGNYGAYVYQYDSNGNILDQIYLYTSTLTVGETFIRNAYLKDDTVSIRPSSTSSGSSDTTNEDSSSSNNNTGSVAENIETLKQYINTNGVTNQAGNKMLNYKNGSQTTAISYVAQTGELQFISSSGNSGMTIVMDSASNMSTLQADYVMYSGGVGFIATGYIEPSTYTSSQTIAFTLGTTNAGEKLTEADIQDLCNAELKVGFYGWQIILYKYLKMELKDIGFTSYQ